MLPKNCKHLQVPNFLTLCLFIINKSGNKNNIYHEINSHWPNLPINMIHIVFSYVKEKNIHAHKSYHMEVIKIMLKEMMNNMNCQYNLSLDRIIDCGSQLNSNSSYSYIDQMEGMLPEFPMEIVEFALNEYCVMTMLFTYKRWFELMSNDKLFDPNSLKVFEGIRKSHYEQIVYYCNRIPIAFPSKKID